MDAGTVRVLLVGVSETGHLSLLDRLEKSGCQCQFTPSCSEGARWVSDALFDLVLCSSQMDGSQNLIRAVAESSASLFRYVLVEDGCWWVPSIQLGKHCAGAPALRPSEFVGALDSIVREIKDKMN